MIYIILNKYSDFSITPTKHIHIRGLVIKDIHKINWAFEKKYSEKLNTSIVNAYQVSNGFYRVTGNYNDLEVKHTGYILAKHFAEYLRKLTKVKYDKSQYSGLGTRFTRST